MSVKLLSLVFDLDGLTATEKLVLLFLADSTNADTQRCDPGWPRIAKKCGLSKRGTQKIAARLVAKDALQVVPRAGRTNTYVVLPRGVHSVHPPIIEHMNPVLGGDAQLVHGGGEQLVHPNQNEPEDNRAESSNEEEGGHHHLIHDGRCRRGDCTFEEDTA